MWSKTLTNRRLRLRFPTSRLFLFIPAALLLRSTVAAQAISSQIQSAAVWRPLTEATNSTDPKAASTPQTETPPPLQTTREHWDLFLDETFSPLSLGGTIFNSVFSQVTHSDPQYGSNGTAFAQRIGASAADIATQNFFGDFLVASALHEDPRYFRRGEQYSFWYRVRYAVSRAFVVRTSSGGSTFNWDNVLGSALSTGLSNAYYPAASRTGRAMAIHFGTDVVDTGFVNLAPEFWPDFQRKLFHRHHHGPGDAPLAARSGE